MLSDDLTAKRGATEEKSDSSVSKKLKVEDEEDTTSREGDSDSDSDDHDPRLWRVETEDDDDVVSSPRINYLNWQDPEPEWDVDSFDGYECYDPEDRKSFSNDEDYEEFRVFKIQAWKNKGFFEEDPFRFISPLPDLEQPFRNMTTREYLAGIASLCVKKLNEEKGSTVEVVSIVRGNLKSGDGWKLYITFMAREYPSGPLVEYQAKAMDFAGGQEPPFPILCRPASSIS